MVSTSKLMLFTPAAADVVMRAVRQAQEQHPADDVVLSCGQRAVSYMSMWPCADAVVAAGAIELIVRGMRMAAAQAVPDACTCAGLLQVCDSLLLANHYGEPGHVAALRLHVGAPVVEQLANQWCCDIVLDPYEGSPLACARSKKTRCSNAMCTRVRAGDAEAVAATIRMIKLRVCAVEVHAAGCSRLRAMLNEATGLQHVRSMTDEGAITTVAAFLETHERDSYLHEMVVDLLSTLCKKSDGLGPEIVSAGGFKAVLRTLRFIRYERDTQVETRPIIDAFLTLLPFTELGLAEAEELLTLLTAIMEANASDARARSLKHASTRDSILRIAGELQVLGCQALCKLCSMLHSRPEDMAERLRTVVVHAAEVVQDALRTWTNEELQSVACQALKGLLSLSYHLASLRLEPDVSAAIAAHPNCATIQDVGPKFLFCWSKQHILLQTKP